jgi:hypothetical protein
MVEKTLIVIIALIFVLSSWWWSHRQEVTVNFYEVQLNQRDGVTEQLRMLALPQVKGKTSAQVRDLLQELYPQYVIQSDKGALVSGNLVILFSEDDVATRFFLPGDTIEAAPSQ